MSIHQYVYYLSIWLKLEARFSWLFAIKYMRQSGVSFISRCLLRTLQLNELTYNLYVKQ